MSQPQPSIPAGPGARSGGSPLRPVSFGAVPTLNGSTGQPDHHGRTAAANPWHEPMPPQVSAVAEQPSWFDQEPAAPAAPASTPSSPSRSRSAARWPVRVPVSTGLMRWRVAMDVLRGALLLAGVTAAGITYVVGAPVLGHPARPSVVGVGSVGALTLAWLGVRGLGRMARVTQILTAALAGILVAAFGLGVHSTLVLDGRIYPSYSSTAKAYRFIEQVADDLATMRRADDLGHLDDVDAQQRFADYGPTISTLKTMSDHYARLSGDPTLLPDAAFGSVARSMQQAGAAGAAALTAKLNVIGSSAPDAQGVAAVQDLLDTFLQDRRDAATSTLKLADVLHLPGAELIRRGAAQSVQP